MIDLNNCFTYAYTSSNDYSDFFQTINTAEEISTNVFDLDTTAGIVPGSGSKPPWWIVRVGDPLDSSDSVEIKLITSTHADLVSGTSDCVLAFHILDDHALAGALLVNAPLPHLEYRKYLGILFTCQGTGDTFTVCSYISAGPERAEAVIPLAEADP